MLPFHCVDDGDHGLGLADGGDGVGAQPGDLVDVHHGEDRFQDHLQDHRDG